MSDNREAAPIRVTLMRFGRPSEEVEVGLDQIITFPSGFAGFEELSRYILAADPDCPPFFWLQSVDDPAIGFAVVDPCLVIPDYTVDVPDECVQLLDLHDPADAGVWAVVTLATDLTQITANLLAPIVINTQARRGIQIIQDSSSYSLRHPLLTATPAPETAPAIEP